MRRGEGLSVERRKDYDYKSLAYRFSGRKMEPFLITVPAKTPGEMNMVSHSGQEFIHVLEGSLAICYQDEEHAVKTDPSWKCRSTSSAARLGNSAR